ncbi:methylenetetrahydrofolate reductase [Defluviicoccus vanus]|nr:methylenetetrahydrofolate reductase [Defluviicoccus vanus]
MSAHTHALRSFRNLPVASPLPRDVHVSFEFFPPRTPQMEQSLWACIKRLATLHPAYVSVTYGAGGTTRERTHATVVRLRQETALEPAAHLTCVGASRPDRRGGAPLLAVGHSPYRRPARRSPVEGSDRYTPHPDGYPYAVDLVAGLKRIADFDISVAAYPETHPEALSAAADLDNLKRKIDAGASRAITQFFFDVSVYFRFVERAEKAGITVPIIPGVLPVTNFAQVVRFAGPCGASIPAWMPDLFAGLDDDPDTRRLVAAAMAVEQCRALHAGGVTRFHFYTLNRADLTFAICHVLGVRPCEPTALAAATGSPA